MRSKHSHSVRRRRPIGKRHHDSVDAAAEARRLKDELTTFVYATSHDLRAPLRKMLLFNDALLKDHAGQLDGKGREYLARIRAAGKQMHRLIESIAALARVTQHPVDISQVNFSLAVHEIAAELADTVPKRDVHFSIQPGLSGRGDPELLTIVMRNLLDNAWKFTSIHPHAHIEFGARLSGRETQYYVRDDGAGFDMSFADKLFRPFERLHQPDQFPGTGIGLAIVDRIVRRHSGRLWAESQVERGATFYFTLNSETP